MRPKNFFASVWLRAKPRIWRHKLWPLFLVSALLFTRVAVIADETSDGITGRLLVASPEMKDPRFVETVIYMVRHNAAGTLGVVINRPLAKGPMQDLLKGLGSKISGVKGEIVIHYGGPVSPGTGFILHTDDVLLDTSIKIKDGLAVTSDVKLLEAMARGKGPRRALVIMGYAGWAPGQLEAELKEQAWFVIPADKTLIFGKDPEKKWHRALDKRQFRL